MIGWVVKQPIPGRGGVKLSYGAAQPQLHEFIKIVKKKIYLFSAGIISLLLLLYIPSTVQGQKGQSGWSVPVNLSDSDVQSISPSLAVDPSGIVHVMWSEATNDGRSFLSYTRLINGVWSQVNEIMTSPKSQTANYPSLAADSKGMLHLVWIGDSTLYSSRAYGPSASQAQGWSSPAALEYSQNNIGRPHLRIDSQDVLYLAYPIIIGGNSGIYIMRSSDGGKNWSDPATVYKNQSSDRMVDLPKLAVAPEGTLHLVWVESNYPETFPPIGIRYARSSDGGSTWSEPFALADGPYSFPGMITRGPDEVHVVYSGTNPDRYKFHIWSADGGNTWGQTFRNTEVGGFQGLPVLVADGNQIIHWLTSASVFNLNKDCLYHAILQDGARSPGEAVLCGISNAQNLWDVAATVALGNELHVVVQYPIDSDTQPEGWQEEIYYLHRTLDAPGKSTVALAKSTELPAKSIANATAVSNLEAYPALAAPENQLPSRHISISAILALSTFAAALFVTAIIVISRHLQHS